MENSVSYYIFNTEIKDSFNIKPESTCLDLINHVRVQHGHEICTVSYMGQTQNPDVILKNNASYTIISQYIQSIIGITRDLYPPDEKNYPIGIVDLEIQTGSEELKVPIQAVACPPNEVFKFPRWRPIKGYVRHLVKILQENEDSYDVKLFSRAQLNHGSGPTLPSLYARLMKNHTMYPYYMKHPFIEYHILNKGYQHSPIFDPYRWKSIDNDTCTVCLEKPSCMTHITKVNDKYTSDVPVCQECSIKLDKCPTCQSHVSSWVNVKYL